LIVEGSGSYVGITIGTTNAGVGTLNFASPSDYVGAIASWDYTNKLFGVGTASQNGEVRFLSANAVEAMRIDSSGSVGIGTTSPGSFFSKANNLVVGNAESDEGLTIYAANNKLSVLAFADGTSTISEYLAGYIAYNHATDLLGFSTSGDGSFRMVIDNVGNVGIGTTTPSYLLQTKDTGTTTAVNLSSVLYVDASNNRVGIGTTSPNRPFHVKSANDNPVEIESTDASSGIKLTDATTSGYVGINAGKMFMGSANGLSSGNLVVDASGNVGIGTTGPSVPLEVGGNINRPLMIVRQTPAVLDTRNLIDFRMHNSADSQVSAGYIGVGAEGTWSTTSSTRDGYVLFSPVLDGTTVERMRITSTGNVGIGTTSPTSNFGGTALHINGTYSEVHLTNPTTGGGAGDGMLMGTVGVGAYIYNLEAGDLILGAANKKTLTISPGGNVGIGDTSPDAALEVVNITTGDIFMASSGAAKNGDRFIIKNSGRVGIGTTSPSTILQLGNLARFDISGGDGADFAINVFENSQWYDAFFIDRQTRKIGLGTLTPQNVLDVEGAVAIGISYSGTSASPSNGLIIEGNVGIGNAAPSTTLEVGSGTFTVNTSSGNVGIGTTKPNAKLDVGGSYGLPNLTFKGNLVVGPGDLSIAFGTLTTSPYASWIQSLDKRTTSAVSYPLSLNPNGGNVGIGTSTPGANSPASPYSSGTTLELDRATQGDQVLSLNDNANNNRGLYLWFDANLANIYFDSRFDASSQANGNIYFRTETEGTPIDAMTIDHDGNVGIGTTTPNSILDVGGVNPTLSSVGTIGITTGGSTVGRVYVEGSNQADIVLDHSGATSDNKVMQLVTQSGKTKFLSWNDNTTVNQDNIIVMEHSTGNVGIGNAAPSTTLEVGSGTFTVNTSSGNVGIGTTTPSQILHIKGSSQVRPVVETTSATGYAGFDFQTPSGLAGQFLATGASFSNQLFQSDELILANELANGRLGLGSLGASGEVYFFTGGMTTSNERMTIDASGNVGIGTASPVQKAQIVSNSAFNISNVAGTDTLFLQDTSMGSGLNNVGGSIVFGKTSASSKPYAGISSVQTTTNGNQIGLAFYTHDSGTSTDDRIEALRIDALGNVGIGTTSPKSKLDVGSITHTNAAFWNIGTKQDGPKDGILSEASATDSIIQMYHDGTTGVLRTHYGTTGTYTPLAFQTSNLERMRIDGNGYVGIGTTSPQSIFHINQTSGAATQIIEGANIAQLTFKDNAASTNEKVWVVRDDSSLLQFLTQSDSYSAGSVKMTIDHTGNVGIGTINPGQTLTVSGTGNITGNFFLPSIPNCDTVDTDAAGKLVCGTDATSAGGFANGSSIWVSYIASQDWSNVTITELQVTDLVHTTDTYNTTSDILAVPVGGEASGTVGGIVLSNTALDDQYRFLADERYINLLSLTFTLNMTELNLTYDSRYYLQSQIDSQAEMETIWSVSLSTDVEAASFNESAKFPNLDTDSTDDLTSSTSWSGDLGGTGSSPSVVNTAGLSGQNITSGTVADARIASSIARDGEWNGSSVQFTTLNVTNNIVTTGILGMGVVPTAGVAMYLKNSGSFWLIESTKNPEFILGESTNTGKFGGFGWNRASEVFSISTTGAGDNVLIDANTAGVGTTEIGVAGDGDILKVIGDLNVTGNSVMHNITVYSSDNSASAKIWHNGSGICIGAC